MHMGLTDCWSFCMSRIDDLEPCTYLPLPSENLVAVGWLDLSSKVEHGHVSPDFLERLKSLCKEPWQPVAAAGSHACSLCQYDAPKFSDNVFVPYQGKIYVAPVAIIHYISTHWYVPPEVFISAVNACPTMNSMEYKRALLANGGRHLTSRHLSAWVDQQFK